MSIKDLFKNYQSNQFKPAENELSASKVVESNEFIEQKEIEKFRYVPPIDFTTASNFAKFGSAELYYEYAFKRIYQQYPYDGTLAEVQEFHNNSTFLDKYIFDHVYPRTNGFAILGYQGFNSGKSTDGYNVSGSKNEYVYVQGGPHTASGGMIGKELSVTFDESTIYNTDDNRASNLQFNVTSGSTVEFWLKKEGYDTSNAEKEVIFDLWNDIEPNFSSQPANYGRFRIELRPGISKAFYLHWQSGSTTADIDISGDLTHTSVADGNWHHYAVSFAKSGSAMRASLYRDGTRVSNVTDSNVIGNIQPISGGLNATIGALIKNASAMSTVKGGGKLSGSIDEFRYWKKERTANEIGQYWFVPVGGGTDDYKYNTDLGVYYKFNEGITTDATIDSVVLDYSGRLSNGEWVGYTAGARDTGSAMVLSGKVTSEFKDPIIYSSHPTVSSSLATYKASGSIDDYENTSLLYHLLPSWIAETDTESGKNVKYLTQIMASYFDTLNAQINGVTQFKEKRYYSGSIKPNTYSREVLRGQGFVVPDLFVDAEIVEEFRAKDVNEVYTRDVQEVKNLIYQNIYNNLNYIYKSKGTEKSFRNLFRCFGVDSELLKLNLYSDDSTYLYKDNYEFTSVAKPVLNLNTSDNLSATVYQSGSNGLTYLSSSEGNDEQFTSMTMECEFIMPYKFQSHEAGYFATGFLTASIAGFHRAKTSSASDLTWHGTDTTLRMYAIRDELESKNVRFVLSGSSINLTSSLYTDVYDNNKWILAARVKHSKHPYGGGLTGSVEATNGYVLEFYGVNSVANDVKNEFTVSQALTNGVGKAMLGHAKRLYVGAHKTNYTGSVVEKSDVKISQLRFWQSHVDNAEIREHSYDPMNYGLMHPYRSDAIFQVSGSETVYVPQIETLALHWDFMTVTASDGSGNFVVDDISSGSTSEATKYSMIGKITKNKYDGYAASFVTSSVNAVDKEFIYAARKKQPDIVYSSDGVVIKTDETEQFFQDDKVADHFYSFEKSPYGAVSDEMIKIFGSAKDFNSLVGDPVERYRVEYKQMKDLKTLFFQKIENIPDPEKFFEYFKWIDSSISYAIEQLIPASSRFAKSVKNIVESHALERNKHQEKFPLVARSTSTQGVVKSFSEMSYRWETGHAPIPLSDNKNCLWQTLRRRVSNAATQNIRDNIYKTSNTELDTLYDFKTSQNYQGNTDAIRRLSRPYKLKLDLKQTIHGGTNYYVAKNRNYSLEVIHPHGPISSTGVPKNVLVVGVGAAQGLVPQTICEDDEGPNHKEKYNFDGVNGLFSSDQTNAPVSDFVSYKNFIKGIAKFPFNIMSQSSPPTTGYQKNVVEDFSDSAYITNLHSDTVDITNEIPMQGPFTETHVGGHQSRHVRLNKYDTSLFDADFGGQPRFFSVTPGSKSNATIEVTQASLGASTSFSVGDGVSTVTFEIDRDNDGVTAGRTKILTGSSITEFAQNLSSSISSSVLFFGEISKTIGSGVFTLHLTSAVAGTARNISFGGGGSGVSLSANAGVNDSEVAFNRYIDNQYTRPESWRFLLGENPFNSIVDGALGLLPPDYGVASGVGTYPDTARHRASFFREEKAKRPLNIRNIAHTTDGSRVGNYNKKYEILCATGRSENNLYFRDNSTITNYLPTQFTGTLGHTTHVMSLFGQAPFVSGNVFGTHHNNRQPDTGSLVLTTPVSPVAASGSFRVFGKDFVTDGHHYKLNGTTVYGTNFGFEIDDNSSSTLHAIIPTGSDDQLWDAIKARMDTQFTTTVVRTSASYGKMIQVTAKGNTVSASTPTSTGLTPISQGYAVGMYINMDTDMLDGGSKSGYLFRINSTTGSNRSREVLVRNTGELDVKEYGVEGGNKDRRWSWNNFFSSHSGSMIHLTVTRTNGDVGVAPTVYVNGVSLGSPNVTSGYSGVAANFVNNAPDGTFSLFGEPGATGTASNFKGFMDNFVYFNRNLTSGEVVELFNDGIILNPLAHSQAGSAKLYYTFDSFSAGAGNVITADVGSINLTQSTANFSSATSTVPSTKPFATFSITGTTANGASGNVTPTTSGTSIHSVTGLAGGVTEVIGDSREAIDVVLATPTSSFPNNAEENHTIIATRFSAPGGIEVQSPAYLDVYAREYSAHNALPFRNLTVKGVKVKISGSAAVGGSGEAGTIRVVDHLGNRDGLNTLLVRHCGKFGTDSAYGEVQANNYNTSPSFVKQHRNTSRRLQYNGTSVVTGSRNDNALVSSALPRSEFQYSWINNVLSGSNWRDGQRILGYSPQNGIVSSSAGYVEAINFPSSSNIT